MSALKNTLSVRAAPRDEGVRARTLSLLAPLLLSTALVAAPAYVDEGPRYEGYSPNIPIGDAGATYAFSSWEDGTNPLPKIMVRAPSARALVPAAPVRRYG